jgi:hypothetical protein
MRVPFASGSYRSRSLPVSAQRCLNLYLERSEPRSRAKTPEYLIGTPGLLPFAGLGGDGVRAIRTVFSAASPDEDLCYAVSGSDFVSVTGYGSATKLGTVPLAGDVFLEDDGESVAALVGAALYVWDGSTLAEVTDSDFGGATSIAFLDSYLLYTKPDSGQFGWFDLGSFTSLDALSVASAEGSPDKLLRVFVAGRLAWLFGTKSTEVWYNSGAAAVPFARVDGGFIEFGLMAKKAVALCDNAVCWVGHDRCVYRADGFRPQRISTHGIEKMLGDAEEVADAFAISYRQEGHDFLVITLPTAGFTIACDMATGEWHERASGDLGYWRASCHSYCYGKHVVGDLASGNLYEMRLDAYDEAGTRIIRSAVSPPVHDEGKRVFMPMLAIDVESGVGLTSGQGSDPQLMLDWSDDGGRTWSNQRSGSMGKIGEYLKRVRFHRLGSFYSRVFRITISDPVKVTIIAAGNT